LLAESGWKSSVKFVFGGEKNKSAACETRIGGGGFEVKPLSPSVASGTAKEELWFPMSASSSWCSFRTGEGYGERYAEHSGEHAGGISTMSAAVFAVSEIGAGSEVGWKGSVFMRLIFLEWISYTQGLILPYPKELSIW